MNKSIYIHANILNVAWPLFCKCHYSSKKQPTGNLKYCSYKPASNKHDGLLDYLISILFLINQLGRNLISVLVLTKSLSAAVLASLRGCAPFRISVTACRSFVRCALYPLRDERSLFNSAIVRVQ